MGVWRALPRSPVLNKVAACLLVLCSLAPSAAAVEPGNVKALVKAKQALRERPNDVEAHRDYQDVMIKEGWKTQIADEYAERLKKQRTAENLYLWARLQEGTEKTQAFETLVKEFPESSWGYYGLAGVRAREGAIDEAIRLYEQVLERDPLNVSAYQNLAYYHQEQGDVSQALQAVERGLTHLPGHVELLVYRATYRRMLEQYEPARADLARVLEEDPDHRQALRQMLYLHTDTKEFEPAVAVGERYLASSPTDRPAWVRLAQSHLALYDRRGSADHLLAAEQACEKAVASDPTDVDAYYELYDYFSDRKWWVHALYYNNRALKLTGKDSPVYDALEHNRSWIPANRMGTRWFTIEAVDPPSPDSGASSQEREHVVQAIAAMRQKQYQQARTSLTKAVASAPEDPLVQYHQTLMRMFDEAVVQGTIEQLHEYRDAVSAGAGINLDTFEVFVEPFERHLARDPTSPEIQEAFGDIFAADPSGAYRKSARPYYEKAIELGGDEARLRKKLGAL